MHVHIESPEGEAKFWMEPVIALADYAGYSKKQLNDLEKAVRDHAEEIIQTWNKHFAIR